MKTIGLVGGVSWVSTVEYYTLLNQMVNARLGGNNTARCNIVSLQFGEITANNDRNDHEANYRLILQAAIDLAGTGCDLLVLCANTMHMHADRVIAAVPIELVHVAEVTAEAVKERGIETVALLGTKYVMEGSFYRRKFEKAGVQVLTPNEADRAYIHQAIFDELTKEKFLPETKQRFLEIIASLEEQGAKGVVLGCTEIPLLISQSDSAIPLFNTIQLHVAAAVTRALE